MNVIPTLAGIVFWVCGGLLVYAYVGYPLLIAVLARCFGRRGPPVTVPENELPFVSLLIAAHNEETVIARRIDNALAMDYPTDRREIVVASDGSTDGTAAIVRRHAGQGIRLLDYVQRRGKSAVLNAAVPELHGDILLFSDANTNHEPQAARRLVRWFADPGVGVVCGRLVLTDPATGRNVDSLYWRYETFLKSCEGRLGALLGANGAIYAMRRSLFVPVPGRTLVDDLVIPLLARQRTGCAIVYDSEATAHEESAPNIGAEFRRRCRIGAGGFQSITLLWRLLHPQHGWLALAFASHKVVRWCGPFLLLGALISNLLLIGQPAYQFLLAAQLAIYLIAAVGVLAPPTLRLPKYVRLATMFVAMNAALLVGFGRWLRGGQQGTWRPTARVARPREAGA